MVTTLDSVMTEAERKMVNDVKAVVNAYRSYGMDSKTIKSIILSTVTSAIDE